MKRTMGWTSRKSFLSLGLLLIATTWVAATWNRSQPASTAQPDAATKARLSEMYGQLPLSFEANAGQVDPQIDFISRGSGYTLFLSPREAVLALRAKRDSAATAVLRMKFAGSEAKPRAAGKDQLPGKINYLTGKDPKQWRTGISTYAKVAYENLYPGVDLVYYGNQRQLEYDFVVSPGTDPNIIALNFDGAGDLKVDAQGELVLHTAGGEIRQRKPVIYQELDGVRHEVAGNYKLKDKNTVGFQIADYDATKPLVIDPVLVYSTFLGGANVDSGSDITIDASGNAYVTGSTQQLILPVTFPTTPGAFDTTHNGSQDVFVTKLNASGSALIYSTFIGGSDLDSGSGIAIDSAGNAYLTGTTFSSDFPTTAGAFDTTIDGSRAAFVTKLNPSGSALIYSTFLGSIDGDIGGSIEVDSSGNAYVSGNALSTGFPTTPGAFDTVHNSEEVFEAFVTKLNPTGSALVYSTFVGGSRGSSSADIELDAAGNLYITGATSSADFPTTAGAFDTTLNGEEVFVTKLNATGTAALYSTFVGGSANDEAHGIAIDLSGNAYLTGTTTSIDFPTTAGAFDTTYNGGFADVFVTKLNPSGSALVFSTYLGGGNFDNGNDLVVDSSGNVYVTGSTSSSNFPTTVDAFDTTYNGNLSDAFVTALNPSGSALVYSTFLGGSGNPQNLNVGDDQAVGIALDSAGNFYVTGITRSPDFPTTAGAFDTTFNGVEDAFVAKFSAIQTGAAATLSLNPPTATNPVDTEHCVAATVQDASGSPVANVVVRFEVTGSVTTSGFATTDSNGTANFCYDGPPLPGADTITAFADSNGSNAQDPGEPTGSATKTWVVPASTPLCEITNGGTIIAANGDRASFGGNAKSNASGQTQGQENYQDHGPAQRLSMQSINVLAVVCDGSTRASIFGQATVDGSGPVNFRINVQDFGNPGKGQDTYQLLLDGYNSGQQLLSGGNIQIRRK